METTSTLGKRKQIWIVAGVIVLFLIPLLFLVFKPSASENSSTIGKVESKSDEVTRLENLVKTNPDYANLVNLSVAYINNNMPTKATPYLEQALQLMPNSAIVFNNLGVVNIMTRHYQQAVNYCLQAIAIDSKLELAKNNLKWAMDEINKTNTQIAEMEKKPMVERNADYYVLLGLNYLYLGNYDKSIATWEAGLKKEKTNTAFMNNIGTALMLKKQYDPAIARFNQVLALEPDNQLAKNNIAWATSEKAKNTKE